MTKTPEQLAEDAVSLTAQAMWRQKELCGHASGAELGRSMMRVLLQSIHDFDRLEMKDQDIQDITAPEELVEVLIRDDGKVLWINVDGICVLRICKIPKIELKDNRK